MATNLAIRGLDDGGFRITNSGGTQTNVKRGVTATVDVDDAKVARVLIRHRDKWVRSSTPNVNVRGLTRGAQSGSVMSLGERGTGAPRLTIGTGNAQVRYRALNASTGTNVRVAHVNPGGTAARSITVSGNNITVSLAVTTGTVNATETATNISAAVNANGSANALVVADVGTGDGTGVVATQALTNLAAATQENIREGTTVSVNVDDPQGARRLRRNRRDFIVGTSNLINIKGLSDEGFRIKNSAGTIVMVKRNQAAVTVNVNDRNVSRVLRRWHANWIEA